MVTVCTVLPPIERPRLDAVGDGCFLTLHATSFRDAMRAARRRRVDALVLSVHACRGEELPAVARFVREFPAIPAVALVSRHDRDATETLLRLGATGVRSAVDCTEPAGWRRLRDLVGHPASPVAVRILARLVPSLGAATGDVRAFFEAVARLAPRSRPSAASRATCASARARSCPGSIGPACHPRRRTSPECGCCTRRTCSPTQGSRWPTWPTAWITPLLRASGAISRRCWASPPESSAAAFPSTCRSSVTSTCSSPRTGRPCARFAHSTRDCGTKEIGRASCRERGETAADGGSA